MPCGYDVPRSYEEAIEHTDELRSIGAREVVAVDAKATFSRPGPRLVDGLELLAHTLHPNLVEEPVHAEAGRPLTVELA
jgi:iron complex transport system substrate-binding protein